MADKAKSHLTDINTFWKLVVIVIAAVIAEALLLGLATSDVSLDWTSGNVNHIDRTVSAE